MCEPSGPCQRCRTSDAIVGLGDPPEWLCLDCFDAALGALAPVRKALLEALRDAR